MAGLYSLLPLLALAMLWTSVPTAGQTSVAAASCPADVVGAASPCPATFIGATCMLTCLPGFHGSPGNITCTTSGWDGPTACSACPPSTADLDLDPTTPCQSCPNAQPLFAQTSCSVQSLPSSLGENEDELVAILVVASLVVLVALIFLIWYLVKRHRCCCMRDDLSDSELCDLEMEMPATAPMVQNPLHRMAPRTAGGAGSKTSKSTASRGSYPPPLQMTRLTTTTSVSSGVSVPDESNALMRGATPEPTAAAITGRAVPLALRAPSPAAARRLELESELELESPDDDNEDVGDFPLADGAAVAYRMVQVPPQADRALLEIPAACVTLEGVVGNGHFARVYQGRVRNLDFVHPSAIVAVKVLRDDANEQARNDFLNEARVMSRLDDPNVVKVFGVVMLETQPALIMEFMPYGDLKGWLDLQRGAGSSVGTIGTRLLIDFCAQIASGMCHLQAKNILHRDIAARNILIDGSALKIADLGLSRELFDQSYYRLVTARSLPFRWMAVESLNYGVTSSASDVWSLGVTMWEIFTLGLKPYGQLQNTEIPDYLMQGFRLNIPTECPMPVFELMLMCWEAEPSERPDFRALRSQLTEMTTANMVDNETSELALDPRLRSGSGPAQESALPELELDRGRLTSALKLGTGFFGSVYRAVLRDRPPRTVAVRSLRPDASAEDQADFVREMRLLAQLDHPNTLRLIGAVTCSPPWLAVVEMVEYGCVLDVLQRAVEYSLEPQLHELLGLAAQVAEGMRHVASHGLVHRDLSCETCLLGPNNVVKVSNFSRAIQLRRRSQVVVDPSMGLPKRHWALETMESHAFSLASDVWSLGVTIWEMLTMGQEPYGETRPTKLARRLATGTRLPRPENCPSRLYFLLVSCWDAEPQNRPSAAALAEHLLALLDESMARAPAGMLRDLGARVASAGPPLRLLRPRTPLQQPRAHALPDWMHGNISREEAEARLHEAGLVQGDFLVREKTAALGMYALSVVHHGIVSHHLIEVFSRPYATIDEKPCLGCRTLQQVIDSLHDPASAWPVVLLRAVPADSTDQPVLGAGLGASATS